MIKFKLPVYFTRVYKNKKPVTYLVGQNKFRNMHFHEKNALKKYYHDLILDMSLDEKFDSEYRATFVYHYKNKSTDLSNVCSLISKFALDALQLSGATKDDTVTHCVQETYIVGYQDKENPRIEVTIEEI